MGTQRVRNDWSNLAHAHNDITHDLLYFYWTLATFLTGGKYGLGAAQGSWSWTFESMSGSSTFHINLTRALLVHMPALGHLMLRWKRKSDYLVISRLKFLFWKLCHVTYCHSQPRKGFQNRQVQGADKIQRSHGESLLGPRKIVFITTYIECKRLE